MSYLQRLAERAMGQSRPLRATAPQRVSITEPPVQLDEVQTPRSRRAAAPDDPANLTAGPVNKAVPRDAAKANVGPPDDPAMTASAQPELLTAQSDPEGLSGSPWPHELSPLLAPNVRQGVPDWVRTPAEWPADGTVDHDDEAHPQRLRQSRPAPLLPPTPARDNGPALRPAFRPGQATPDARQPATKVEETTEVHVTIGRIEVTAVQETPAQKTAARRRPAPMSLDEYIARRQGGRA